MQKWLLICIVLAIVALASWLRLHHLSNPPIYLFDEDLHIFTAQLIASGNPIAYEWWHPPFTQWQTPLMYRPPAVEWLHPPLAKYVQAAAIASMGNTPLAWRLPSALAGIGLVLAVGLLAHQLFHCWPVTLLSLLLAAVEHLLVVQSRLASADIFVALFSTLTLAFFAGYQQLHPKWLMLTAVWMGLALASKWSGFLILAAVIVLACMTWLTQRHHQNQSANQHRPHSVRQLVVVLITVTIIPLSMYGLVYLHPLSLGFPISHLVELHHQAWLYHTTNRAYHPHSSTAYQWLLNQKPVWYYYANAGQTQIIARQTPVLWAGGLLGLVLSAVALLISALKWFQFSSNAPRTAQEPTAVTIKSRQMVIPMSVGQPDKSKNSTTKIHPLSSHQWMSDLQIKDQHQLLFLVVAFLCLWAPWLLVQRPTFIYHYLPCLPLLLIMCSYWLHQGLLYLTFYRNLTNPPSDPETKVTEFQP